MEETKTTQIALFNGLPAIRVYQRAIIECKMLSKKTSIGKILIFF